MFSHIIPLLIFGIATSFSPGPNNIMTAYTMFNFGFKTNTVCVRVDLLLVFGLYLNEIISPGFTLPQLCGCFLFAAT